MEEITADFLRAHPLPRPSEGAGKDERGRVLIVAGGREVPGAAWLSGIAALRAGAGKLHLATGASVARQLGTALPEARVTGLDETAGGEIAPTAWRSIESFAQSADAVLVGPGMLDDQATRDLVHRLLDATTSTRFVLDAAAITALGPDRDRLAVHAGRIVVTPHAGEMARLLGWEREAVEADPESAATRAAELIHGIVALKGGCTYITKAVEGNGEPGFWSCARGNVGLATSGSGDVLAGLLAGLLARGTDPLLALQWAVFLHGEAGTRLADRIGPIGYLASELLPEIPGLMASLDEA